MTSTADEIRVKGDRARELNKLLEHPSWETLRETVDERRRWYFDRIARRLTNGDINASPLNQREIDYQRGFFRGVQFVLDSPAIAERELLRALERRDSGSG